MLTKPTCICGLPPGQNLIGGDPDMKRDMIIDHRCPKHGEKAQPALWGRHKELELVVTPKQWESLSVEENTTE